MLSKLSLKNRGIYRKIVGCLSIQTAIAHRQQTNTYYPYLFFWTRNDHYRRTKMKGSTTRYRIRERYWTVEEIAEEALHDPRWRMVAHQGWRDWRGAASARSRQSHDPGRAQDQS